MKVLLRCYVLLSHLSKRFLRKSVEYAGPSSDLKTKLPRSYWMAAKYAGNVAFDKETKGFKWIKIRLPYYL